jgi:hypothetical protein
MLVDTKVLTIEQLVNSLGRVSERIKTHLQSKVTDFIYEIEQQHYNISKYAKSPCGVINITRDSMFSGQEDLRRAWEKRNIPYYTDAMRGVAEAELRRIKYVLNAIITPQHYASSDKHTLFVRDYSHVLPRGDPSITLIFDTKTTLEESLAPRLNVLQAVMLTTDLSKIPKIEDGMVEEEVVLFPNNTIPLSFLYSSV